MRKSFGVTVLLMVVVSAYLGADETKWRSYESSLHGYSGRVYATFLENIMDEVPDMPRGFMGDINKGGCEGPFISN